MLKRKYNFDYSALKLDKVKCDLCGSNGFSVLSNEDRYGLPARTVVCCECGLIFINPRMNARDYEEFYNTHYRNLLVALKDEEIASDLGALYKSGFNKGKVLYKLAEPFLKDGLTIEVGSSCGGVLGAFLDLRKQSGGLLDVLGIEPSRDEAAFAEKKGIKTRVGLIENLAAEGGLGSINAANILCVRTLNHLLSPKEFFKWSYERIISGGALILMTLNFIRFCERQGKVETQTDHPFMFSMQVLTNFVKSAGFEVKLAETLGNYLYIVAKKNDGMEPFSKINKDPQIFFYESQMLGTLQLKYAYFKHKIYLFIKNIKRRFL